MIKGKASVYDNGEDVTVTPGDVVQTNSGETHSIKNIGDTTLKFIALIIQN